MASILIRAVIIFILLSFSLRIMGKREIGELEVGELVAMLIISEICSIPIDDPDIPLFNAVIPVLFIVCCEIVISFIKNKSRRLKSFFDGKPTFIIKNGRFCEDALRENRISLEELLGAARQNGIADIREISYCILESSGKISIIKEGDGSYFHTIISDGELDLASLKALGLNEGWLTKVLEGRRADEVFYLGVDDNGKTNIVLKDGRL